MTQPVRRRFVVFGYATTHDALDAEHILKSVGVQVTPIPTPRELGVLCGIALRVPEDEAGNARAKLEQAGAVAQSETVIDDV